MRNKLIAGVVTLAAIGGSAGAVMAAGDPAPTLTVDVTAGGITFEGTPQINTLLNRIVLDFKGQGERAVALVQLKPGVTIDQFGKDVATINDPSEIERYGRIQASTFVTGPSRYVTTTQLVDADYVFVDFTKQPAARLGFHAGPGANGSAAVPVEDIDVRLHDYRVSAPSTWKAGKRVVRVLNQGSHQHHALLMPLRKGVDAKNVARQVRAGKEPRNALAGPPSALVEVVSPKAQNYVETNLAKGKYLLVCFVQNSPKSKPHAMLGMEKVVTVR